MTSTATLPARVIPTRRIEFDFRPGLHKHFMNGDLVQSHAVTVLSCMFPEGEDFFVRSVRNYRDRVTDPELKRQVAGFIGQEAIHGREHREFNERLGEFGYPTRLIDRSVHHGLKFLGKVLPKRDQLAVTAALEHYTATLAEALLSTDMAELSDVDEVAGIFQWHALEESEHKSVAFDVFQQVCGKRHVRVGVMRVTTVVFLAALALGTAISLARVIRAVWSGASATCGRLPSSPLRSASGSATTTGQTSTPTTTTPRSCCGRGARSCSATRDRSTAS